MIHRLEIENFYSVRNRQIIDLRPNRGVSVDGRRLVPLWPGAADAAPAVVALFGANASGKSTILKALSFIAWYVVHSVTAPAGQRLPFLPFNDDAGWQAATRLAVEFAGIEDVARLLDPAGVSAEWLANAQRCLYRYEVDLRPTGDAVHAEALAYRPAGAARWVMLFKRSGTTVRLARQVRMRGFRLPDQVFRGRPEASVVSVLNQYGHPFAQVLATTASSLWTNILIEHTDWQEPLMVQHYANNPSVVAALNHEIERVDIGIDRIEVAREPFGPSLRFHHRGIDRPLSLPQESHGTRQFLKNFPLIHGGLERAGVAVVDELDTAIHPLVLREIVRWFQDPLRNPRHAQIWMSCQTATLLEDLQKEEIWLCEKNAAGETSVYGLAALKGVRRDDNFYAKYLTGALGAVPAIG